MLDLNPDRPIFQQIAELIEDAIMSGAYAEEQQIPSITELSVAGKINPATALKGVNLLVDEGLLYKKRGLGMFVSEGAKEKLTERRRESFRNEFIVPLLEEAAKLGLSHEDVTALIR